MNSQISKMSSIVTASNGRIKVSSKTFTDADIGELARKLTRTKMRTVTFVDSKITDLQFQVLFKTPLSPNLTSITLVDSNMMDGGLIALSNALVGSSINQLLICQSPGITDRSAIFLLPLARMSLTTSVQFYETRISQDLRMLLHAKMGSAIDNLRISNPSYPADIRDLLLGMTNSLYSTTQHKLLDNCRTKLAVFAILPTLSRRTHIKSPLRRLPKELLRCAGEMLIETL